MNQNTLQHQVTLAARYLDVHHPGWFSRINIGTLNMSSCMRCVIGQAITQPLDSIDATRMWTNTMDQIFGGTDWTTNVDGEKLGFTGYVFANMDTKFYWVQEIVARRGSFVIEPSTVESHAMEHR